MAPREEALRFLERRRQSALGPVILPGARGGQLREGIAPHFPPCPFAPIHKQTFQQNLSKAFAVRIFHMSVNSGVEMKLFMKDGQVLK